MTRSLKLGMALKTLSALHRRHPELRLTETHPGGGMYDCLGLHTADFQLRCTANLAGTSLALNDAGRPRPPAHPFSGWESDVWRYPEAWFRHDGAEGLATALEERLGLPSPAVVTATPATVALGVVAELAGRYALSNVDLQLRSGWHDSSGMGGCHLRDWVKPLVSAAEEDWEARRRIGNGYWQLDRGGPKVLLDLKTGRAAALDLWQGYRSGQGIRELAWALEGCLFA